LALTKSITTSNTDIYLYDIQTKQAKLITQHTGDVSNSPQTFSPDNKKLYFTSDEGGEFAYLKSYDLASGKIEKVAEEPWDIVYMYFSRNGKYRVIGINNDAKTEIKIYSTADNQLVKLPAMPNGEITGVNISESEKQMAFYVSSSKSPNSLYVYDFASGQYKELMNAMNPEIAATDLVEGEVVRFKSYDGTEVPNILYKPKNATDEEKMPVMLMIHGGPGGQTRLNYSPMVQYLVNHGYAILAVNNRGSSGYGKTHRIQKIFSHAAVGGYDQNRNYGRQLRRLHDAGGFGLHARRIQSGRGYFWRCQLAAYAEQHSAVVGFVQRRAV
jgi:dipeptidyl aminopeptidase/acylaminoacyl peptidase